jgi:hypothetical protein
MFLLINDFFSIKDGLVPAKKKSDPEVDEDLLTRRQFLQQHRKKLKMEAKIKKRKDLAKQKLVKKTLSF